MEEKQLNFNKPLLSVRRFPSKAAIVNDDKSKTDKSLPNAPQPPRYKSELKSGPLRNPGTVPFVWEQSPGRPKDETKPQTQAIRRPPSVPKLPPGRVLKANGQDTYNASAKPSSYGNQVGNGSRALPPLDDDIRKCGSPKGTKEEEEENSSSVDGDGAYVDARDTLSRTESVFINCSVSGLSGLDDANIKTPTDPETRDFMMGRFLPAAKAMASETPQPGPRKPPKLLEQPRLAKKVIGGDKQARLRYGPNFVADHDNGNEESDDDYDDQEILRAKVCGLLPRLGFKSSFCLLNPLPGMSVRTRSPMSPLSKIQATSSSSGSCGEFDSEQNQFDMREERSVGGFKTINPQVNRSDRKNAGNQITHPSNYKKREGIYGNRQMVVDNNGSLQLYEHKPELSVPEEVKNSDAICLEDKRVSENFQEILADQNESKELAPVVEKTLYVDAVHKKECLNIKQNQDIESSLKDIEKLNIVDNGAKSSSSDKANQYMRKVASKPFGQNKDFNKDSIISASLKVSQEDPTLKAEKFENYSEFLAPPPLPKTPTDSWLGRTLPFMSARKPSTHLYLGSDTSPRYNVSKPKSSDPKWETIVKTTATQHQHMRFSEERLTTISET